MQFPRVLDHLAIGHCPLVDAQRAVVGTRLTLFPERADTHVDAPALLAALSEVWPDAPQPRRGGSVAVGTVALNAVGEPLLRALLQARPPAPYALEVPAFMLSDRECLAALVAMKSQGCELWLKGHPPATMPATLLGLFRHLLLEGADAPPAQRGALSIVAIVTDDLPALDVAIKRGAVAAAGWPWVPATPGANASRRKATPELNVVIELIKGIDREDPIERLEDKLKGDPTLAFRLLRYLNSTAFGFSMEISSLGHALMLLGYQKLKRWLALLLASASKDPNLRPVMHAAVRRGFLLEELSRGSDDEEQRGEMFMCGVFSLLDRMLQQPFAELLSNVPVPDSVRQALVDGSGPLAAHLELARAIEAGSAYDVREIAGGLMLGSGEINRALLAALRTARQLD